MRGVRAKRERRPQPPMAGGDVLVENVFAQDVVDVDVPRETSVPPPPALTNTEPPDEVVRAGEALAKLVEQSRQAPAGSAWATDDMLGGDKDYDDVLLPVMQRLVRVRFLDSPESTRLQGLPDYAGFVELAQKLASGEMTEAEAENEPDLAVQTVQYQAHVAHLAIMQPDASLYDPELCADCSRAGAPFKHVTSLWSLRQTLRMPTPDLDYVTAIALRAQGVMELRPFSTATEPGDSPEPAAISE